MGRVTVTEVLTGDVATAANVNATMTSFVNQSTDVDANCVRESGIWRQTLTARAFTPTNGRSTFANAGPSGALTDATDTLFSVGAAVKVGPVDNAAATDQVLARFSVAASCTDDTATLQLVLAYSTDDVTYTAIAVTRRKFTFLAAVETEVGAAVAPKYICTIAHYFPIATATSATLYFRPMYQISAGSVTFDNATLMAQVYAK